MKQLMVFLLVLLFASVCAAHEVALEWDPNQESDIAGYRIYQGTVSGTHGTTPVAEVSHPTTQAVPCVESQEKHQRQRRRLSCHQGGDHHPPHRQPLQKEPQVDDHWLFASQALDPIGGKNLGQEPAALGDDRH